MSSRIGMVAFPATDRTNSEFYLCPHTRPIFQAAMNEAPQRRRVPALKVRQWLPGWEKIDFAPNEHRAKPLPHFYLLSLPARELRSLSGISRRQAQDAASRSADLGIQRQHDPDRSEEIGRYVEFGYPWSTLSEAKRKSREFNDLRKPGWLPTAIVLNILKGEDRRNGASVASEELVNIREEGDKAELELPYAQWRSSWRPSMVPPFEIIDGQHRLWSFETSTGLEGFELPVVAFCGLDISWQAYLFWTINIKPKRINPSLAFDLYPLLRTEEWLDRAEGHAVYRETRAQELTEALWSHPESPWYDRINMLGERQIRWVSQSAWIKSLVATMVRPWQGRGAAAGGLFGARLQEHGEVLGWSRAQQAAFLIYLWQQLRDAVKSSQSYWAVYLRRLPGAERERDDTAFYGPHSLITTDQGVRGHLHVVNDLCFVMASRLKLNDWMPGHRGAASAADAVSTALRSLHDQPVASFVRDIALGLSSFDWRTSSTPGLSDELRRMKLVFRGSSGYKEIRAQLLEHLTEAPGEVGPVAKRLLGRR